MALDIDWKNPRQFARRRPEGRRIDLLAASKLRRRKRKSGKAHATAKDIAIAAQTKNKMARKRVATRNAEYRQYKDRVRAYWLGETDEHP